MLYKVICNHRSHRHGSGLSVDPPIRQGLELYGQDTIWNLTEYLFDNPDIVFIVYKTFRCDGVLSSPIGLRKSNDSRGGHTALLPESETIQVVSDILRAALIDIADCSPWDGDMDGDMLAPYLFVYHHRTQLQDLASQADGESAPHVSCLLSYIQSHHGSEYDDAESKLGQHVVTAEHLTKLWIPNHVVVSRKGNHDVAYVLADWPKYGVDEHTKREVLTLKCWSWEYDGTMLNRKFEDLTISLAGHDEMPFSKLVAFPLDSGSEDLSRRLRDRGHKFWKLRYQHLVKYDGLDFNMEKTYVRIKQMKLPYTTRNSSSCVDPYTFYD